MHAEKRGFERFEAVGEVKLLVDPAQNEYLTARLCDLSHTGFSIYSSRDFIKDSLVNFQLTPFITPGDVNGYAFVRHATPRPQYAPGTVKTGFAFKDGVNTELIRHVIDKTQSRISPRRQIQKRKQVDFIPY